MKTTFIYGLAHPNTGIIRYTGKSNNPQSRYRGHLYESKSKDYPVHRWTRKLAQRNLKPALIILAEVPQDNWIEAERYWISHYATLSEKPLLNIGPGGEGPSDNRNLQKGTDRPASKLTETDVIEMRTLRNNGATLKSLSQRFGVAAANVSTICQKKGWKHVKTPPAKTITANLARKGEQHGGSKLTWVDVKEIRHLFDTGRCTQKTLAAQFNVTQANISMIVRRNTWKD